MRVLKEITGIKIILKKRFNSKKLLNKKDNGLREIVKVIGMKLRKRLLNKKNLRVTRIVLGINNLLLL
jgi:hypothetical protein